ncbi:MAG: M28 family metallopeptidase [Candidatus Kapabacteria bacterium]|jgi:carboxypeptidase Q|nr:M28 family metallopeptidase [Candidatus Kapabacteria bacterium]
MFYIVVIALLMGNTLISTAQETRKPMMTPGGQPILTPQGTPVYESASNANVMYYSNITQRDSAYMHKTYGEVAKRILQHAMKDSASYKRLQYMCDTFGPRFSGTQNLERAIDWLLQTMKSDGHENVRGEEVKVPAWVRGEESCVMLSPRPYTLSMLGLGGSTATPKEGITAEVLVVKDFAELQRRSSEAKGKIVLFNAQFTSYRNTVRYRSEGAVRAAEVGAVASLVRSVASYSMRTPHTGGMRYQDSLKKIPHAAISTEDADIVARMTERGEKVTLRLTMNAQTLPDAVSRNVLAELKGSEKPDEIVVMGGHIDSWDVGTGALDDAGGCFATWKALQILKELGLRPRRTVRLALWTNEENGLRGGAKYAELHGAEKHVLAFESDGGIFAPKGFGFTGAADVFKAYKAAATLLQPIQATEVSVGGGGADISPLIAFGVPQMNIDVEGSKYFWFHHTHADTPDKIDPLDLNKCAAAIAVMIYIAADLP